MVSLENTAWIGYAVDATSTHPEKNISYVIPKWLSHCFCSSSTIYKQTDLPDWTLHSYSYCRYRNSWLTSIQLWALTAQFNLRILQIPSSWRLSSNVTNETLQRDYTYRLTIFMCSLRKLHEGFLLNLKKMATWFKFETVVFWVMTLEYSNHKCEHLTICTCSCHEGTFAQPKYSSIHY